MEITEVWEAIDSRVDWLLAGIISLLLLNVVVPLYVGWTYMGQKDFHDKHNLQPSEIFVEKSKMLEDLPTMDDIEVPPPKGLQTLPKRYVSLQTTDLFIPPGSGISTPEPIPGGDTAAGTSDQKTLPKITGYEIVGRIFGKGDVKASVIRELGERDSTEEVTFVVREGDYLENTDVKVVDISDTLVKLDKPEHRVTTFRFEVDKIKEKIRQRIKLQ